MEPVITSRSSRRKRGEILSQLQGLGIMCLFAFVVGVIYLSLFSYMDQAEEAMKMLGQNIGSFVVTVGVSYPAFFGAIFPIRISKANEVERKELLEEVFSFVITFVAFIFANAFALIAVHTSLSIKGTVVASMLGSLIGLTFVFITQINKLLK